MLHVSCFMTMTDPITDMFNQIRNAQAVNKPAVNIPWSKFKYQIAKILEREGFIEAAESKGRKTKKVIRVVLKYDASSDVRKGSGEPIARYIKRISKPGQRIYASSRDLRALIQKGGMAIISTPKGLMTDKEARRNKLGGEVLCEIW